MHADVFGIGTVLLHDQREVHVHARLQLGQLSLSRTEYGITMAFMYPGIAVHEAVKLRCGRSTFRMIPVTG